MHGLQPACHKKWMKVCNKVLKCRQVNHRILSWLPDHLVHAHCGTSLQRKFVFWGEERAHPLGSGQVYVGAWVQQAVQGWRQAACVRSRRVHHLVNVLPLVKFPAINLQTQLYRQQEHNIRDTTNTVWHGARRNRARSFHPEEF